jgi:hypothetical protein
MRGLRAANRRRDHAVKTRSFALNPVREVLHVDRLGYIELEDAPKLEASAHRDRPDESPYYKTTRHRAELSNGEARGFLYSDGWCSPAELEAVLRLFGEPEGSRS